MMWNLQSYPTTVLYERLRHIRRSKHTLTPSTCCQGVKTRQPFRINAHSRAVIIVVTAQLYPPHKACYTKTYRVRGRGCRRWRARRGSSWWRCACSCCERWRCMSSRCQPRPSSGPDSRPRWVTPPPTCYGTFGPGTSSGNGTPWWVFKTYRQRLVLHRAIAGREVIVT